MKRIIPAVAVVLFAVLGPVTATQAAGNASVTFVQGIGPAPKPIDVYIDDVLVSSNLAYTNSQQLSVAEGSHVVKLCNHDAAPPNPLAGACPSGAVNQNGGDTVAVVGGSSYTMVGAYAPSGATEGRPTVLLFQDDLACTSNDARMDIYHAAAFAGDVDLMYQAQLIADNVPPAGIGRAHGSPKTADVQVLKASDQSVLVNEAGVTTTAQQLTIKIFVGNPQQNAGYALITRQVTLTGCPTTTTTTVVTTSTTSTTVRSVAVTPRFTG